MQRYMVRERIKINVCSYKLYSNRPYLLALVLHAIYTICMSTSIRAHRIRLYPNNQQATYFRKACGVARKAYNWALDAWHTQYNAYKEDNSLPKPNQMALRKQLNAIKEAEYPWMLEVTKCAPQMAIIQLGKAWDNFFKGRSKAPRFRKKGIDDRFTITNDQFSVDATSIKIPKLGLVRMAEKLRFKGKLIEATVSRVADKWFVSIAVELEAPILLKRTKNQGTVGIDLGIKSAVIPSKGAPIDSPKPLKNLLKRLQRLSRSLSRKQKGSQNRKKACIKLACLHERISNIRKDWLHKTTRYLASNFDTVVIENLNVSGMMRNRRLSRAISDIGFYELRRQLEYKAPEYGTRILVADRFFASSKTCSCCGYKLDTLSLSTREWTCPDCGTEHDRDFNAAKNLENLAGRQPASVCGEESSGRTVVRSVKLSSTKQKVNLKSTNDQICVSFI